MPRRAYSVGGRGFVGRVIADGVKVGWYTSFLCFGPWEGLSLCSHVLFVPLGHIFTNEACILLLNLVRSILSRTGRWMGGSFSCIITNTPLRHMQLVFFCWATRNNNCSCLVEREDSYEFPRCSRSLVSRLNAYTKVWHIGLWFLHLRSEPARWRVNKLILREGRKRRWSLRKIKKRSRRCDHICYHWHVLHLKGSMK